MTLSKVTHIVFYRPYRAPANEPKQYVCFNNVREAMSFQGTNNRYCSSMDLCKVDVTLTEELLQSIARGGDA